MQESRPPDHDQISIVLVGSFNPKIFQPAWFAAQGLIRQEEATEANIEIVNNDICIFESSWFRVEIFNERWALLSRATPAVETLRDLAVGTFSVLRHAPVKKVGLNAHGHYTMPSREALDNFGHAIAPKEDFWLPVMEDPRLLSLTVRGERTDGFTGGVRGKIEPSGRIQDGLFVEVNDEFTNSEADSAEWAIKTLSEQWENHRNRVASIRENIVSKAWGMQ
ncbi:hypothetical protein ACFYXF_25090 [Streptomyces sp. NPDC002680]|uniref:hypothetical protein n=1 Tax=Streptomyces sp. NPDC002680 TaxID=3364659 RepID=UPI00367C2716